MGFIYTIITLNFFLSFISIHNKKQTATNEGKGIHRWETKTNGAVKIMWVGPRGYEERAKNRGPKGKGTGEGRD